jgi:hypothetical protein
MIDLVTLTSMAFGCCLVLPFLLHLRLLQIPLFNNVSMDPSVLPITDIAKHKTQMAQCLLYVLGVGASLPQEMESSRWRLRKLKALGCFAGKN